MCTFSKIAKSVTSLPPFYALFDDNRFVIGTDASSTLIADLRAFLDECQKHNIFMILVLFNGAVLRNQGRRREWWGIDNKKVILKKLSGRHKGGVNR